MNSWSMSDIRDWQESHLQAFVKQAYQHTKYYHELFDSLNIKPEDIKRREDLKRIPISERQL